MQNINNCIFYIHPQFHILQWPHSMTKNLDNALFDYRPSITVHWLYHGIFLTVLLLITCHNMGFCRPLTHTACNWWCLCLHPSTVWCFYFILKLLFATWVLSSNNKQKQEKQNIVLCVKQFLHSCDYWHTTCNTSFMKPSNALN